jgi:hypothetical protein
MFAANLLRGFQIPAILRAFVGFLLDLKPCADTAVGLHVWGTARQSNVGPPSPLRLGL